MKRVRAEVDASRNVSGSIRYLAYGAIDVASGLARPSVLGYTGQLLDPNGLYYLRARWYDPTLACFLTRDALGGDAADPRSLNAFGFAGAAPTFNSDPSGWRFVADSDAGPSGPVLCGDVQLETPSPIIEWTPGVAIAPAPIADVAAPTCVRPCGVIADPLPAFGGPIISFAKTPASVGAKRPAVPVADVPSYPVPNLPRDPREPPGPEYEWRGGRNSVPGDSNGSWTDGKQSLHPDFGSPKHEPHDDWKDPPQAEVASIPGRSQRAQAMRNPLVEVDLGQAGRAWVERTLENGGALSREARSALPLAAGRSITFLPSSVISESSDLEWGIDLSPELWASASARLFEELRLSDGELLVAEDTWKSPVQAPPPGEPNAFAFGGDLYYWINLRDVPSDQLERFVNRHGLQHSTVAFVADRIALLHFMKEPDPSRFLASTRLLVVGAYDDCGYVIWSRSAIAGKPQ
jgi:RHS repeat-associated protein